MVLIETSVIGCQKAIVNICSVSFIVMWEILMLRLRNPNLWIFLARKRFLYRRPDLLALEVRNPNLTKEAKFNPDERVTCENEIANVRLSGAKRID